MKELIKKEKEIVCTLPTRFVRELQGDENSLINTYRQMSPEYKSIFFALATQMLDKQIENEIDTPYSKYMNDDNLFYYVSDVEGFFKACDFLEPCKFCELVIVVDRNLEHITIYGFHFGDISDCAHIVDEMEMFRIMEYVYENIKTPAHFEEQLKARWFFTAASFYEYKMMLMA